MNNLSILVACLAAGVIMVLIELPMLNKLVEVIVSVVK